MLHNCGIFSAAAYQKCNIMKGAVFLRVIAREMQRGARHIQHFSSELTIPPDAIHVL